MRECKALDHEYTDRYIQIMESRERLLATGLRMFVDRGYDAVGVQQIVAAAGVTKPSLYHHFGSKAGLLEELALGIGDRLTAELGGATRYARDLPRNLEQLAAAFLSFADKWPAEARLLLAAQNGPVESETRRALAGIWSRLVAEVEQLFRAAAEDHGNMRGRSGEYTVAFLGAVCAYMVRSLDGKLPVEPSLAHRIMRQFSYGIYT